MHFGQMYSNTYYTIHITYFERVFAVLGI